MIDDIALIVPTHNRKEILFNFLNMLSNQTVAISNVIVVNDGSTDGTLEMIQENFPKVIILNGDGSLWWTSAVNMGIQYVLESMPQVKGIILQNDDVYISNNWLESIQNDIIENPNCLIGCINVSGLDKKTIRWAGKIEKYLWLSIYNRLYLGKNIEEIDINKIKFIESFDLIGRGVYIPCNVFKCVGLFDDIHFKHRGDMELPLRARMNGYKLIVSLRSIVYDMPDKTSLIDIKEKYSLKDFKYKFFDFRSSSYWKYKYYYTKIFSKNRLQHLLSFNFGMLWLLINYLKRLSLIK